MVCSFNFITIIIEAQHTKANNKHRYLGLSRHYVGMVRNRLKLCSKILQEFRAANEKLDMKTCNTSILLTRLLFLMN